MSDKDRMAAGEEEARRRIAACKAARNEELDLGGLALQAFPPEVLELTWLKRLFLGLSANARKMPWFRVTEDDKQTANVFQTLPSEFSSALSRLEVLDLSWLPISDLSPLHDLDHMRGLNCAFTLVDNLSPLRKSANLVYLVCDHTKIRNLKPVTDLPQLLGLTFSHTSITDLTSIDSLRNLQILDFSETAVIDIEPLKELVYLENLTLHHTRVRDLSPTRGMMQLRALDFSGSEIDDLTPLQGLAELQCLAFSRTEVADLSALQELTALQSINCSITQVTDLSPIATLTALKNLQCSGTQVKDLTPIAALTKLQSLECSGTQVKDLSPIATLTNLQSLECSGTQVKDLTPIAALTKLQSLGCSSTQIKDLSPVKKLTRLTFLSCKFTLVTDLTPIQPLSRLQHLNFTGTNVSSLIPLQDLIGLRSLECASTRIVDLVPLKDLPQLQHLGCFDTRVDDLAPLERILTLRILAFSNTKVADLTPLSRLKRLEQIGCSDTKVSDLTPIAGLTALQILHCSGLKIETPPPPEFWMKDTLQNLRFHRTRIPGLPPEVLSSSPIDNCLQSLRAHLADLGDAPVEMSDAKLMILGNGRVGKTQLVRRLRGEGFEENADSTHGILVADLAVPGRPAGDPARFHVWDFGGQDIYHGTHALFLRSRAVFVICWTPAMEDSDTHEHDGLRFRNFPLAYWLDHVRQFAGDDAPVLVVQTQCDAIEDERDLPDPAREALKGFSGFKRVLHTSARDGHGFAALKEDLNRAYTSFNPPLIGPGRAAVKTQLEAWRAEDVARPTKERKHQTLSYATYLRLCDKTGDISDPAMLLRFLHNAGTVFHGDGILHDKIILDQQWALEAIYAVFHRGLCYRALKNAGGRFTRPDLGVYLWDKDYEPEEQRVFLSMMESCGICFAHRNAHASDPDMIDYIAPELLPTERPGHVTRLWDTEDDRDRRADFACDVLPETLIRGIIAEIGQQAGVDGDYWATGLSVFEDGSGAEILIEQQRPDPDSWSGNIVLRARPRQPTSAARPKLLDHMTGIVKRQAARFGVSLTVKGNDALPRAGGVREEEQTEERALSFSQAKPADPEYFVSYAWADDKTPEGRKREADVDRLCADYGRRGIHIVRDKDDLGFGDSISKFMRRIGAGDRVFVFLSYRYLKSSNCMFELFEIWRTAQQEEDAFLDRVRVFTIGDVDIWSPMGRLRHAAHWKDEFERFKMHVKEHGADLLSPKDHAAWRRMREFAHSTGEILTIIADRVHPRTFEEFLEWGFDDPPNEAR